MRKYGARATAMIYDTFKLAEQLEHEAAFDPARARAMARILAESAGRNLVTKGELKAEIQSVRTDLDAKIRRLDGEFVRLDGKVGGPGGKVGGLAGKFGGLDEHFERSRRDILVMCWMSGATFAGVITLLAIAIIALHVMHLE